MAYLVQVTLLLDAASEAEARDGVNEILRKLRRDTAEQSCLVDYSADEPLPCYVDFNEYEKGDIPVVTLPPSPDAQSAIMQLRAATEHVLCVAEDGCVIEDIDFDMLRSALSETQKFEPDLYQEFWDDLKPVILAKMTALAAALKHVVPYTVSGLYISGPGEEFGADQFRISVDLKNAQDITVLCADFELSDGADAGEVGFAVSCNITGYNALVLGGFMPENFQCNFYTSDKEELDSRVDEFNVDEFTLFIVNDALTNETLLKEVAEASV